MSENMFSVQLLRRDAAPLTQTIGSTNAATVFQGEITADFKSAARLRSMAANSVQALLEDVRLLSEERYQTVQAVRALAKRVIKPLSEVVKFGGILFSSDVPFGGVFAYKEHVSVEFSRGATIPDTLGQLEGNGKLRRHIKLVSPNDVNEKQLVKYFPLALEAAKSAA